MTIRTYRESIPWLGAGVLLVGLIQAMAVVPVMEAIRGESHDYLHENILGLMLVALALVIMARQPLSGPTVSGITLLLVAAANVIFGFAIGSLAWFVIGVIEALAGAGLLYLFWRSREAVRSAGASVKQKTLLLTALVAGAMALAAVGYAYFVPPLDARLWFFAVDAAMLAIAAGCALLLENRRHALLGAVAIAAGAVLVVLFFASLLA